MPELAKRMSMIEASGIRRIFDLAANLKDPVNLSIGQPDFDVPAALKDKAAEAMRLGKNAYTQTQGGPELRAALLDGPLAGYADEQILVTGAVSGGLLLAYMALLDPGDEILLPDPYFVMYKQLALMFDARPVFYDTYPDWKPDPAKIEALITPRTKALLIDSPSNPTGAVYTREELSGIAGILDRHNLIAISDEIYESFCYDAPFVSLRSVARDRTLCLGGFSKSHAMTGWRVGWAAGPAEVVQAMTKLQQFSFVCAPTPFQSAAAAAVAYGMEEHMAAYGRKRDLMYAGLIDAGYQLTRPAGAFYAFPEVPWGSGAEFVAECVKNNLLCIPGNCFSERDTHFRLVFAAKDETIERGVEILRRLKPGK
ncbi:MAG: aminotransferase class I/II-fold pyridoxal phosphate-dependent enzyme [Planctomycetota bacterium]|jgi:aspartate aminotransferase/aminotransferase|nr:aminotransferase class I/II-fold pyridoxal phosphate-dependent enzyme [Planctomycetota bacterium]